MADDQDFSLSCPLPIADYPHVTLAHGGGGTLMRQLIEKMLIPTFDNPMLDLQHDGSLITLGGKRIAFTTDSYVVHPLFFPGGDIGELAVNGTVNDLAMCGARPLYLSAGLILEEGLSMETLWRVVQSMQAAARKAKVQLVTGDTKVVDKGKGDGIFINTAGVGILEHELAVAPSSIKQDDVIILSGDIGRHGMAVMAVREGLEFESTIQSDCASVAGSVQELLDRAVEMHCLRDLTRGGLASALVEIAASSGLDISVDENAIPVRDDVLGACEILGFDPLYVANEGRFIAFVPASESERAVSILRSDPLTIDACIIGKVGSGTSGVVTLTSKIGAARFIEMLSGEQFPRIC